MRKIIILGAHGFKPAIPGRNPHTPKFNNPRLRGARQNIGKAPAGTKRPRVSSGFRLPDKPVNTQSFQGGGTGLGASGSESPEYDSNPHNPSLNTKGPGQCQNANNSCNQPQKKKKKNSSQGQLSEKEVVQAYLIFMSEMRKQG
jgi:hypothetical protein